MPFSWMPVLRLSFLLLLTLGCLSPVAQAQTHLALAIEQAERVQLHQHRTWQRLMYAEDQAQSEIGYTGYFYHPDGRQNLKAELIASVEQLFIPQPDNLSIQCRFPARSTFLIQQLGLNSNALPTVECSEYQSWLNTISPHQIVFIYATDFMGNPSSMFGHTLLRVDPDKSKDLSLVSYAINYAATVGSEQSWSYAWKGLTGQYDGEYSLMPYYHKVKEYGDFESRDLWEYELNLNQEETAFLMAHLWEMKHVSFPYYFISDNCAYRLLGLFDLVRPELNLKKQFNMVSIPVETIKALDDAGLIAKKHYRPALATQLLAQEQQHGQFLARVAKQLTEQSTDEMAAFIESYTQTEQAQILEMAYDYLYLQLLAQKVLSRDAQAKLRFLLSLRSQLSVTKQREDVATPQTSPEQGHHARQFSLAAGQVQHKQAMEVGYRQAYHQMQDPIAGYRLGTELKFLDVVAQLRENQVKLKEFGLLSVHSHPAKNAFEWPLSWGFDIAWQQEAIHQGKMSTQKQHGVFNINLQAGYSVLDANMRHLCYGQAQMFLQAGQALDQGWRVGLGPSLGCQQVWTQHLQSNIEFNLPFWQDQNAWNFRNKTTLQYASSVNQVWRLNYQYQKQQHKDMQSLMLSYHKFY